MRRTLWTLAKVVCRTAARLALRLPLIALFACTLLSLAPGFDSDERRLDLRFSASSVAALHHAQKASRNPLVMCAGYLKGLARGDLGESTTFGAPVLGLVRERWATTGRSVLGGLGGGWILAAGSAVLVMLLRSPAASGGAAALTTALICIPSALLGVIVMLLDGLVEAALAAVIFPRVYQYTSRVLAQAAAAPHVRSAEAAGVTRWRLFWFACLPPAFPELLAVAAASVSMALASVVPLEVICDSPGLGQLAWKATLGRDVPLLLFVTLAMTAAANLASAVADLGTEALARSRS
ncbi:MAG: ABC transporter permease subunit [Acidobacteriia bacterium]|nr:ABC transporter permease subunit [Terriglobia bacterium]